MRVLYALAPTIRVFILRRIPERLSRRSVMDSWDLNIYQINAYWDSYGPPVMKWRDGREFSIKNVQGIIYFNLHLVTFNYSR